MDQWGHPEPQNTLKRNAHSSWQHQQLIPAAADAAATLAANPSSVWVWAFLSNSLAAALSAPAASKKASCGRGAE
eukprot:9082012-Pyramimonas_sp.AAC.1